MELETKTVRDLLPVKAVQCHRSGTLVPFYRSCKGEGKEKPCENYLGNYLCTQDPETRHGMRWLFAKV